LVDVGVKKAFLVPLGPLETSRDLRIALDVAATGKVDAVASLAASHVEVGAKCVVFTHRRVTAEAVADALVRDGVDASVAHGGMALVERQKRIAEQPSVLCCTIDSCGAGIDLSYASVGIFAELTWVPASLIQAEGRLHRFGATRPVLFQYAIATGSADELVAATVVRKLDAFEAAVGPQDDGLREGLTGGAGDDITQLKRLYETLKGGAS